MKDYIQKIIHAFTVSSHDEKLTRQVHQWLVDGEHADEKEAGMHSLWEETEAKADVSTWASLESVYNKIGISKEMPLRRIHFWHYAAAVVVLFVISVSSTYFLTKKQYSEIAMVESMTEAGHLKKIQLPDGSIVETNSSTVLFYPEIFSGDTRTVYLIGEANFKVTKNPDKPFIVRSADMAIMALGTEFNVSAYPEDSKMIATLIHGKVKVDCEDEGKSYVLAPAQQVIYDCKNRQSTLADAQIEDVTAWQKGLSVFRGMTMKDILSTLERNFGVTFQYKANLFNDDKYNFRFRQNSGIDEVMAIIKEIVGSFDYKLEGDVCYIKPVKKIH